MDKWSDDQLKKMELGGNIKAKEFFEASPDYYAGMSIKEKYSSVFAAQYKEKVKKNKQRTLQMLMDKQTSNSTINPRSRHRG